MHGRGNGTGWGFQMHFFLLIVCTETGDSDIKIFPIMGIVLKPSLCSFPFQIWASLSQVTPLLGGSSFCSMAQAGLNVGFPPRQLLVKYFGSFAMCCSQRREFGLYNGFI